MRAPCNDCGKDTRPVDANGKTIVAEWDEYIVRPEVWRAAGMGARGFLCTPCLSKRLGRKLTAADYLARPGGVGADGKLGFITTKVDALRIVALEEAARRRATETKERRERRARRKRQRKLKGK